MMPKASCSAAGRGCHMNAQNAGPVPLPRSLSRRDLYAAVLSLVPNAHSAAPARAQPQTRDPVVTAGAIERTLIATVERGDGLIPPLTLGMARVILQPGASVSAATPHGTRMIVVESGVLAVASVAPDAAPITSAALITDGHVPAPASELLVPAGTTMTFGAIGIASVRNPGTRSVVVLDVAVYHEEPRPMPRAFTSADGVSFQLLASGNATEAPLGRVLVALERVRLGVGAKLPTDLSHGLTLAYISAGGLRIRAEAGEVAAARAATAAPYSMPGALTAFGVGDERGATAGGIMFLPVGAAARIWNVDERHVELMTLSVREAP
jgi:hypothetical protein